jgi:hypothetical protein
MTLFEEDFFKSFDLDEESGVLMKTRGVAHPEGYIRTKKNGRVVQKVGGKWVAYKGGAGKAKKEGEKKKGSKKYDLKVKTLKELNIKEVFRTERAHESYKGKSNYGSGLYTSLSREEAEEYTLNPHSETYEEYSEKTHGPIKKITTKPGLKVVELDMDNDKDFKMLEDIRKKTGDNIEKFFKKKGIGGLVIRADGMNYGGNQLVMFDAPKTDLGEGKIPKEDQKVLDDLFGKEDKSEPGVKSHEELLKMGYDKLYQYAYDAHKVDFEGVGGDSKKKKKSTKAMANIIYQVEMLSSLGFPNNRTIRISFENYVQSIQTNSTTRAMYQQGSPGSTPEIIIGNKYKNSFVHEYFHHLDLTQGERNGDLIKEKRSARAELITAFSNTRSFKKWSAKEANKKYWIKDKEIIARMGNQYRYYKLRGKKPDVRMAGAPDVFDFKEKEFEQLAPVFEQYMKVANTVMKAYIHNKNLSLLKSLTFSGHKLQDRIKFQGMDISVENKKGSVRKGKGKDGKKWRTKMLIPYGYIKKTIGQDKDHLDCFVGPDESSQQVFVVKQIDPDTKKFDEDKVMLGFTSGQEAKKMYLKHYDSPKYFGNMKEMTVDELKDKAINKKKVNL